LTAGFDHESRIENGFNFFSGSRLTFNSVRVNSVGAPKGCNDYMRQRTAMLESEEDLMGKILFAIGTPKDWALYTPDLIAQAHASNSSVHVLEVDSPLGTGLFTSNKPPEDDSYPEPVKENEKTDPVHLDLKDMPEDTAIVALETSAFLNTVADSLRANNLEVTAEWVPNFDLAQLGEYAALHNADTVALITRGWWTNFIQGDIRPALKEKGLKVIDLKESDVMPVPQAADAVTPRA
jgi:hypothetical protein